MGLRNTLEPDPDNTGVGSFLQPSGFLHLTSRRELLCFRHPRNEGSVCKQPQSSPAIQRQSRISAAYSRHWHFACALSASPRAQGQEQSAPPRGRAGNKLADYRRGPAKASSRHHHRHRPRRSAGQLSSRIRHGRHADGEHSRMRRFGDSRHSRSAQRPGLAPALRRGEKRRLGRRRLRARGLLRRLPDSRLSPRSGHRT